MAAINIKVTDYEGNLVKKYVDVIPEYDIVNKISDTESYQFGANELSENMSSESEVTQRNFAAYIAPQIVDNWYSFTPPRQNTNFAKLETDNTFYRFVNNKDTDKDFIHKIPAETLMEINKTNPGELELIRLVCEASNISYYIGEVDYSEVYNVGDNNIEYYPRENYIRYRVRIDSYDVNKNKIGEIWVEPSDFILYEGQVKQYYQDLLFSMVKINKFDPKYYSDNYFWSTRYIQATIKNNGYIGLVERGNYIKSNEFDPYLIVPVFVLTTLDLSNCLTSFDISTTKTRKGIVVNSSLTFKDEYSELNDMNDSERLAYLMYNTTLGMMSKQYYNEDFTQTTIYNQSRFYYVDPVDDTEYNYYASLGKIAPVIGIPYVKEENGDIVFLSASNSSEEPDKNITPDIPTGGDPVPNPNGGDPLSPMLPSEGDFEGYPDIGTDKTNGLNNHDVDYYNSLHRQNFTNFVFKKWEANYSTEKYDSQSAQSMFEEINAVCLSNITKDLYQIAGLGSLDDIFTRCYELPFDWEYLMENNYAMATPVYNMCYLCSHKYNRNTLGSTLGQLCYKFLGYDNNQINAAEQIISENPNTALSTSGGILNLLTDTVEELLSSELSFYPASKQRWYRINYGKKTINRMFGNSLDYTHTTYTLTLPFCGDRVRIDPNWLFRDGNTGNPYKYIPGSNIRTSAESGEIEIYGMLDIDTGYMLINVEVNGNMIYQTSANVASDRLIVGRNNSAVLNNIMTGIKDITQMSFKASGSNFTGNVEDSMKYRMLEGENENNTSIIRGTGILNDGKRIIKDELGIEYYG